MFTGVHSALDDSALDDSAPLATLEESPAIDDVGKEPVDDEPVLVEDEHAANPAVRTAAANTASNRVERGIQSLSFWSGRAFRQQRRCGTPQQRTVHCAALAGQNPPLRR